MNPQEATQAGDPQATFATGAASHRSGGGLFWLGLGLAVASLLAYVAQVNWANSLATPWYMPIGGTLGAAMMLLAVVRQRRWWQFPFLFLFAALAGLEWYFLLGVSVLPAYAGALAEGQSLPPFHAKLASGEEIGPEYFAQGQPTALILFQGRWCPFCMTQLRDLEAHQAKLKAAGGRVAVISIEDVAAAAETQREFPHLVAISDERHGLTEAISAINAGFAPDGGDAAVPTTLLIDGDGKVRWIHRPARLSRAPQPRTSPGG